MNRVLPLVGAAHTSSDPGPGLYSDHMLAELLARHEEMVVQLRRERVSVVGDTDFLTRMIDQHKRAAEMLRLQLEKYESATA